MIAHVAAAPALERLAGWRARLAIAGAGRDAAYLDLDGFVVVLTGPGVPLLPNAIALTSRPPAWPAAGARVQLDVTGATAWDSTLSLGSDPLARGHEILTTLDHPPKGARPPHANPRPPSQRGQIHVPTLTHPSQRGQSQLPVVSEGGLTRLGGAVGGRGLGAARAVGEALVGRGGGLTPEGDDLVAAAAAVVAAGPWEAGERQAWLTALIPADARTRTTALSATLLELSATGRIAEPVHGLFGSQWRPALERLLRLGHSTGGAYALAAATAATRLREP